MWNNDFNFNEIIYFAISHCVFQISPYFAFLCKIFTVTKWWMLLSKTKKEKWLTMPFSLFFLSIHLILPFYKTQAIKKWQMIFILEEKLQFFEKLRSLLFLLNPDSSFHISCKIFTSHKITKVVDIGAKNIRICEIISTFLLTFYNIQKWRMLSIFDKNGKNFRN